MSVRWVNQFFLRPASYRIRARRWIDANDKDKNYVLLNESLRRKVNK